MAKNLLPMATMVAIPKKNPLTIAELTADLTPKQLRTIPEKGAWTAVDVLAHLHSCADVWGSCIAAILAKYNLFWISRRKSA